MRPSQIGTAAYSEPSLPASDVDRRIWSIDGKMVVKRIEMLEKEAITWTTMGLDPGLCSKGPVSDHLRYGITSLTGTKII
jgi:hypothetical protein